MDNNITVRFFSITAAHASAPPFEQALQNAYASSPNPVGRERDIATGVRVRIERLAPDGSFRDGDIVRRQSSNLPPEANDAGLIPLPVSQGGGLGHCVAFRYSPALKVLAIQFDTRAVVNESFAVLLARDRSRGNLPG